MSLRFWLLVNETWFKVTKAEYVAAEQKAGFRSTVNQSDEPATSAFANPVMDLWGSTLNLLEENEIKE